MSAAKPCVLFVCTANAARSQLAEALLRELAGERFEARSAGTRPGGVHPLTRVVLAERGIDASGLRSKSLEEALARGPIEYAVLVCARAAESCPNVGALARQVHAWPFDDPAAEAGDEARRLQAFRDARDAIEARLRAWLAAELQTGEPLR